MKYIASCDALLRFTPYKNRYILKIPTPLFGMGICGYNDCLLLNKNGRIVRGEPRAYL